MIFQETEDPRSRASHYALSAFLMRDFSFPGPIIMQMSENTLAV